MDNTYMSSKGQVVIPKVIRDAVGVKQGTRFKVEVDQGRILLTPIPQVTPDDLYGCEKSFDLTADLEADHLAEIQKESPIQPMPHGSPERFKKKGVR